jgi:hypothetical protein
MRSVGVPNATAEYGVPLTHDDDILVDGSNCLDEIIAGDCQLLPVPRDFHFK